jgi:hypothetical protein
MNTHTHTHTHTHKEKSVKLRMVETCFVENSYFIMGNNYCDMFSLNRYNLIVNFFEEIVAEYLTAIVF